MSETEKDRKALIILQGLVGLTFQAALDQIEYTKDFLLNRVCIRELDTSLLCKKGKAK